MPQRKVGANPVMVSAPDPLPLEHAGPLKVGDDPLNGPLGNADPGGNLAKHERRVLSDQDQHMRVIREKRPACPRRRSRNSGRGLSRADSRFDGAGTEPVDRLTAGFLDHMVGFDWGR